MVLVAAGLALRALLVMGVLRFEAPVRLVNILTISYIGFFVLDYFWISARLPQATVHLVCFLAVIKILTATTNRDYAYTAVIALMELGGGGHAFEQPQLLHLPGNLSALRGPLHLPARRCGGR